MAVVSAILVPFYLYVANWTSFVKSIDPRRLGIKDSREETHNLIDKVLTGVYWDHKWCTVDLICRTFIAAITAFTGHTEIQAVRVGALLAIFVLFSCMLAATVFRRPANLDAVNVLTTGSLILCAWSCVVALVTCAYQGAVVTWIWLVGAISWGSFMVVEWCRAEDGTLVCYLGWKCDGTGQQQQQQQQQSPKLPFDGGIELQELGPG